MYGYAVTGSFCTHKKALESAELLVNKGYDLLPILSENVINTDTRFGKASEFIEKIEDICKKKAIKSICEAEVLGPKIPLEALIVSPCTGNTLAKFANGITDTSVTMAMKAHSRQSRKMLIALCSNDSLSSNLKNIAALLLRQNIYFVPLIQDEPTLKPHSFVSDFEKLIPSFECMLAGNQLRPLFI